MIPLPILGACRHVLAMTDAERIDAMDAGILDRRFNTQAGLDKLRRARELEALSAVTPLTFAYADPPYVGCSQFYDHPDAARWDDPAEHVELMHNLDTLDGWALSCSVPSLEALLNGAPREVRIGAWVKPFAAYKRNVRVAYTWEPVLWKRNAPRRDADPVGRDHLSCPITMRRGFTGAKPAPFVTWLRVLLGAQEHDEIIDLFPGSGAVTAELDRARLAL